MSVSAQTVWRILDAKGLPRLSAATKAAADHPLGWTRSRPRSCRAGPSRRCPSPCDHAGLLLFFPAIVDLDLPDLVAASGYPSPGP